MRATKGCCFAAGVLGVLMLSTGCGLTSKVPGMGWLDRTASNPFRRSEVDVEPPSLAATPRSVGPIDDAIAASDPSDSSDVSMQYPSTGYGSGAVASDDFGTGRSGSGRAADSFSGI